MKELEIFCELSRRFKATVVGPARAHSCAPSSQFRLGPSIQKTEYTLVLLIERVDPGHVTRPDLKARVGFNNFYDPVTRMTRPG